MKLGEGAATLLLFSCEAIVLDADADRSPAAPLPSRRWVELEEFTPSAVAFIEAARDCSCSCSEVRKRPPEPLALFIA